MCRKWKSEQRGFKGSEGSGEEDSTWNDWQRQRGRRSLGYDVDDGRRPQAVVCSIAWRDRSSLPVRPQKGCCVEQRWFQVSGVWTSRFNLEQ